MRGRVGDINVTSPNVQTFTSETLHVKFHQTSGNEIRTHDLSFGLILMQLKKKI